MRNLNTIIESMKVTGEMLVPYNYPRADPRNENDLSFLKLVDCVVDGYYITLHFSKADYPEHFLSTLQIFGQNAPFLPFTLVLKIARKFFGDEELCLVEMFKSNRKIYCWTLQTEKDGDPMPSPHKDQGEQCFYDGFEYTYMDSSFMNFY